MLGYNLENVGMLEMKVTDDKYHGDGWNVGNSAVKEVVINRY